MMISCILELEKTSVAPASVPSFQDVTSESKRQVGKTRWSLAETKSLTSQAGLCRLCILTSTFLQAIHACGRVYTHTYTLNVHPTLNSPQHTH